MNEQETDFRLTDTQMHALDEWIDARGGIENEERPGAIRPHFVIEGLLALGILVPAIDLYRAETKLNVLRAMTVDAEIMTDANNDDVRAVPAKMLALILNVNV